MQQSSASLQAPPAARQHLPPTQELLQQSDDAVHAVASARQHRLETQSERNAQHSPALRQVSPWSRQQPGEATVQHVLEVPSQSAPEQQSDVAPQISPAIRHDGPVSGGPPSGGPVSGGPPSGGPESRGPASRAPGPESTAAPASSRPESMPAPASGEPESASDPESIAASGAPASAVRASIGSPESRSLPRRSPPPQPPLSTNPRTRT